jgi:hypothetical protein
MPTPLYWAPTIVYGSTRFYLPPWVSARVSRSQFIDLQSVPRTNRAVITRVDKNQGTLIALDCSGVVPHSSQAEVIAWLEQIWEELSGKVFKLFLWSDRGWEECALDTHEHEIGLDPLCVLQGLTLSIRSANSAPTTSQQLVFTDYANEYPYAALVGRPAGVAATPGVLRPVTEPSQANYGGTFHGVLGAASVAGEEHVFRVGGSAGSSWRVRGIQITSAELPVASATTTIRLSTQPIGGADPQTLDVSVASDETFSDVSPASILVTEGDALYVYATAGGGHQNLQYRFLLTAE